MIVRCWGSRGSIAVSGRQYVTYGGDTTCLQITARTGETVIVDAGTGIRRLGNFLLEKKISRYYLLLTHCHWDHLLGFSFFRPLLYSRNQLIVQNRTFGKMTSKDILERMMSSPFFPIRLSELRADIQFDSGLNDCFNIGSLQIDTIPTSHSAGSLGYRFRENGRTFVFLTDNELGFDHPQSRGFDAYRQFSQNADILFHDAEYTEEEYLQRKGWGHSSIPQVLELALKANVGQLGFIHLSQDRTDAEMDAIVQESKRFFLSRNSNTRCYGVTCDFEIAL
jgi:phosphoribosyl 1,2-cyclic phosphodiesterase